METVRTNKEVVTFGRLIADALAVLFGAPLLLAVAQGAFMAARTYRPPRTKPKRSLAELGVPGEALELRSSSGVVLRGWFSKVPGASTAVVICHELGSLKESKARLAQFYLRQNVCVLLIDMRNHGASENQKSFAHMSDRFTDDVCAGVTALRSCGFDRVLVHAFSFSTFPALYVLQRPDCQVDGVIVDSGPRTQIAPMFGAFMEHMGFRFVPRLLRDGLLGKIVTWSYAAVGLRMLGVDWPPKVRPDIPILFIAGDEDPISPAAEVAKMSEMYAGGRFWSAPNAGHLLAHRRHAEVYETHVLKLIDEVRTNGAD
jgi:pimeloyl-ACP methyl ester carboxylesterase